MLWVTLICLVLAAASWAVVLIFTWPIWIAIVASVFFVLVVVGVFVFRRVRALMRASALERELLKQAAQQADKARPDRRPEILALQQQMKTAIEALKRSRLGKRGGRSALYALPWYVIIGPPAAGKTTALTQSGLGFITPNGASAGKVRGTAGTRNCDWWFSDQAILLDTAGRLATQEDDRDEWLSFLTTVSKFRAERPLDGMVVALSVEDLLNLSEVQLEEQAQTLRARIDEVTKHLEMVLPIYVMFTKVDLLGGFTEFFQDLSKAQRAQAWGTSFSLEDDRLEEPARAIETEFELLVRVLHARMLDRLSREPLPEVRSKILSFPMEFQSLKANLARFVEELCRPNFHNDAPLLRGFYFSSGTQTGRSFDRLLDNISRGLNLQVAGNPAAQRQGPPQSYFVTELFQKVVFPDRHLAMRSESRVRRRFRRQVMLAGGFVFGTLAVITPPALSYVRNAELIRLTDAAVKEAVALERSPNATATATASVLDLLVDRVQILERASEQAQLYAFWGPYKAPELLVAVKKIYLERLRSMVAGTVQKQLVADVRRVADLNRMDADNFQESYDNVKLYIMLCDLERLQPEWATEHLSIVWARALRSDSDADKDKLLAHSAYYIKALQADPSWAFRKELTIVSRAQGQLSKMPIDELRYSWLQLAARGVPAIRPDQIFRAASLRYWTAPPNAEVPGLYTLLGWQKVKPLLEAKDGRLVIEPWVLGLSGPIQMDEEAQSSATRLRELYFQRYEQAWRTFLVGLEVKRPQNNQEALTELGALTETNGPYDSLFRVLAQNVRLDATPSGLVDKLIKKGVDAVNSATKPLTGEDAAAVPEREITPVERAFMPMLQFAAMDAPPAAAGAAGGAAGPSKLQQYITELSKLELALRRSIEDPEAQIDADIKGTESTVRALLGRLDLGMRAIVEPWLMNPIYGSRILVVTQGGTYESDKWKTEVWEVYNQKIAGKYPFADSPTEVSLAEFADFFRPQAGILWKYFSTNLEKVFERRGNSFQQKNLRDPLPYRADFMSCLNVSQEITDAIFGTGTEPALSFQVRIHPVGANIAEIQLNVDGTPTTYRNEPERFVPVIWPGKGNPKGGTLLVKGADFQDQIPRLGDFGLFRLLAAGNIKALSGAESGLLTSSFLLTRTGESPVVIDIKPSKSVHPFSPGFFKRLRCPPVTMSAVAPAGGGGGG
ncbi:MAG TPA: type VI secretion system membrane subunit TssM [Polyangiaceae bacterium]|nr:type VI secretion system membrane subunit TssM [Polyangiaceae bacterium]